MLLVGMSLHFIYNCDIERCAMLPVSHLVLSCDTHTHVWQGGQLVVKHQTEQKEFEFGEAKGYSICCTAFYAGEVYSSGKVLLDSLLACTNC